VHVMYPALLVAAPIAPICENTCSLILVDVPGTWGPPYVAT
jgi:hypothetical protein